MLDLPNLDFAQFQTEFLIFIKVEWQIFEPQSNLIFAITQYTYLIFKKDSLELRYCTVLFEKLSKILIEDYLVLGHCTRGEEKEGGEQGFPFFGLLQIQMCQSNQIHAPSNNAT